MSGLAPRLATARLGRVHNARSARLGALTLALLASVACGGSKPPLAPVGTDEGGSARLALSTRKAAVAAKQRVVGHTVADLGERTIGPFLAHRGPVALAAWILPAEGTGRRVVAAPLDVTGELRGPERTLAFVPVDTTSVVVRPMRGPAPGFVVAWTSLVDRGESLWAAVVGDDAVPRGKAVELARTTDDIAWVDVVPTDAGAVCLWAEETRGGDANIVAAGLDTDGKIRSVPVRVAHGVTGWHALEIAGGVGLSTVTAASASGAHGDAKSRADAKSRELASSDGVRGGRLSFAKLDAEGHPISMPVPITTKPVVSGDVEVAASGSRLLFAWTDRSADDPSVSIAALDAQGTVEPPHKLVGARGGASLVALTSGPAGVAVAWESAAHRRSDNRNVHIARVSASLAIEGRPETFEVVGREAPELVSTPRGFAFSASMRDCAGGVPSEAAVRDVAGCADPRALPIVVSLDARLRVLQRDPLDFNGDPASMAWGIACPTEVCLTLAASGAPGERARVRVAEVRPPPSAPATSDVAPPSASEDSRIAEVTSIASGHSVVDLAVAHVGSADLVAMLSTTPEGRPMPSTREPVRDKARAQARTSAREDSLDTFREPIGRAGALVLSTRLVDERGAATTPIVLSTRALAVGGVSVAMGPTPDDGGAVAWVARENGDPEVHVTRIDRRGKRTKDIQLTTTKGDASDVAITWTGGAFIVAWVDARDGNGEVYATKLTPQLERISREERITRAPGDASDLVALAHGDVVWLAWADSRESPNDGMADVFVTAVRAHDAKRSFDEVRVLASAAHSRTPQLALTERGLHVAWIEEAPEGLDASSTAYGAHVATLDASGKVIGRPTRVPLAGEGAAGSVALETDARGGLRAVVARATADAITLDGVELGRSGASAGDEKAGASAPRAFSLVALDGPPSLDVALALSGPALYFNDDGPTPADRRARRGRVRWSTDR